MNKNLEFAISIATEGPRRVCITPLPPRPTLTVPISFADGFKVVGENLMTTLTDIQKVTIGPVAASDAKGNPAPIESLKFSSSDEAILSVTDNGDGTASVTAVGPLGMAQVRVDADARIGDGEVPLSALLDFEVIASEAVALNVPVGTPENA